MKRYLPFIFILIVLAGAVGITLALWRRGGKSNAERARNEATNPPAQPGNSGSITQPNANDPGLTKPNVKVTSPVVLEEYGDYQCPPCGQLYPELKKVEAEYGNQVRIIFHHFPLAKMHKNAMAAARPAEPPRTHNNF